MERKLLDMMNQLSISEYNPRMEYCDKFRFISNCDITLPLVITYWGLVYVCGVIKKQGLGKICRHKNWRSGSLENQYLNDPICLWINLLYNRQHPGREITPASGK